MKLSAALRKRAPWLMQLPTGWQLTSLEEIVNPKRPVCYGIVQPGEESADGVRIIRSGDVREGVIRRDLRTVPQSVSESYRRSILRGGEVVVSLVGDPGQAARVPQDLAGANIARQVGLVAIDDAAIAAFVELYLNSTVGRRVLLTPVVGSAQQVINIADLKKTAIVLPPRAELLRIVDIAGHFTRTGTAIDALLGAKHDLKVGLMQQLLKGQRRYRKSSDGAWIDCHLGDVFTERNEINRLDLPLLSVTGDRGVIPRDELDKRDTSNPDKSKYKRVAIGDVAYNTMRMWQGVSALSSLEGIVSPAYTVAVPTVKIDGVFAKHLFKFPPLVHLFYRNSQGLVDDTLNLKFDRFSKVRVRIPSDIGEQRKIATLLDMCDAEMGLIDAQREQFVRYRRGLLARLLSGELQVPT